MAITKIQSESLNLADDFAFTGTITGAGGNNKPAFYAYNSSATSLSNGAYTKVNFQTEVLDSDNCFASGTFTPNTAGYYFLNCQVKVPTLNINHSLVLYKNGSQYTNFWDIIININGLSGSCMVYANGTTDYFDVYYYQASGSSQNTTTGQAYTFFSGFKIIT